MPISHGNGIDEQTQDNAQPEKCVSHIPQPTKGDTLTQNAEHIVQYSQYYPQRSCTTQ